MNHSRKYLMLAILLVGIGTVAQAQMKIGYINRVVLMQEIPDVKQANSNLEALQKQLQAKYEGMVKEFEQKYQDLAQKEQRGELSPKEVEEEGKKLQGEQTRIGQYEQEIQQQLVEKQNSLLKPIVDKMTAKIAEVAKEEGYTYIIDDSAGLLLYKDESLDITAKVKTKLGL